MTRLLGLAPIVGPHTRALILGSFPGMASLKAQQYYAHPRNQFWLLLQALWPQHPLPAADRYECRCAWLLARGLGLWDVYASCERAGSADSAIRHARINDFAALRQICGQLRLIVCNGGESFKHAKRVCASLGGEHLPVVKLPSSSPANAGWSFERKLAAWREALGRAGVC